MARPLYEESQFSLELTQVQINLRNEMPIHMAKDKRSEYNVHGHSQLRSYQCKIQGPGLSVLNRMVTSLGLLGSLLITEVATVSLRGVPSQT